MTDSESRIQNLENTVHHIDKRQESFETFMRGYIEGNEKRLERMETDFREMKDKLDNLLIAGGIGLATILASIWGTR